MVLKLFTLCDPPAEAAGICDALQRACLLPDSSFYRLSLTMQTGGTQHVALYRGHRVVNKTDQPLHVQVSSPEGLSAHAPGSHAESLLLAAHEARSHETFLNQGIKAVPSSPSFSVPPLQSRVYQSCILKDIVSIVNNIVHSQQNILCRPLRGSSLPAGKPATQQKPAAPASESGWAQALAGAKQSVWAIAVLRYEHAALPATLSGHAPMDCGPALTLKSTMLGSSCKSRAEEQGLT